MIDERDRYQGVRSLRVLVDWDGPRVLFKLVVAKQDTSFYLFPAAPNGRYFYGSRSMSEEAVEDTFDYTNAFASEECPKVSVHESGQVHVQVHRANRAGPLALPRLPDHRGQAVASVTADTFAGLRQHPGRLRTGGAEIDHLMPREALVENGRVIIYVNGVEPRFAVRPRLTFTITRPSLERPLYLALAPVATAPLGGEAASGGVTVLAWDGSGDDYLYVRGE